MQRHGDNLPRPCTPSSNEVVFHCMSAEGAGVTEMLLSPGDALGESGPNRIESREN